MNGFRIAITIVIAVVLQILPQSEVVIFKTAFRVTQIISTWRVDRKMTRSHCLKTESRRINQSDKARAKSHQMRLTEVKHIIWN